jgi:hypothetical protein
MDRKELINIGKIGTNILLSILIGLLLWQFFTANELVKDIALYDEPEALVDTYKNITGFDCICGKNVIEIFNKATTESKTTNEKMPPIDWDKINLGSTP